MRQCIAALLVVLVSLSADADRRRAVGKPSTPATLIPVANFVDTHINDKLVKDGIVPAALADDAEFLRRVTLDLTGTIPAAAEAEAFLANGSTSKRAQKIDELLASAAFTDRWTMWFGDLVQNVQISANSREYYTGRNLYYLWIRDSIAARKPYDAMVRELLAGEGDSFQSGVANYIVRQLQNNGPPQDTYDNLASHSVEKFLGIPVLCISCHDGSGHLEQVNWYLRGKKRDDFWKMAAFFAQTTARPQNANDPNNPNVRKFLVGENPNGRYRLNTVDGNKSTRAPAPGQPDTVSPAFLTTGETPRANEKPRVAYGRMLTADRQFARATVNYLWKELFGRGIVEPVNAFDLAILEQQATHPALLEQLTDEFIARNYDLRALLRTMALSSTYQLSATYTAATWNEAWVPYFARRYPRRLSSEAVYDAIVTATGVTQPLPVQGLPSVDRAMQLPDPLEGNRRSPVSAFLNAFGRGDRDETARTNDSSIAQSLALLNDTIVTQRVKRATRNSTVGKVLAATNDPATIADQLYLATLSRRPTTAERALAITHLTSGNLADRAEDLQYALINSLEFLFV